MRSALLFAALSLSPAAAAKDGICILYADDVTRSFYFSGVSPTGALAPLLLTFPKWDSLLLGLDAGEDDDTFFIVPEGVGSNPNMTIATLRTNATSHTASVSYATLGSPPAPFDTVPYTYMNTLHLDAARSQMIATLVGLDGPPPARRNKGASRSKSLKGRRSDRGSSKVGSADPGDLFYLVADVFPANGTISRVWLDLSEQDMRWGSAAVSGVSAFAGSVYWINVIGAPTPSSQSLWGFPLNGSAPTVVQYGPDANLAHLFYSSALGGLLAVIEVAGQPSLARFSPPSTTFETIFSWAGAPEDWGLYDVSPDGSMLLSVLVDKNGENPFVSVVDLKTLKEASRVKLQGFSSADTVCDVNFCNL